jgi:hypothetical protein
MSTECGPAEWARGRPGGDNVLYLTESGVPQMLAQSITEPTENR